MYVTFFQIKKILESNKKIPYHIVKYLIKTDFLLNNITQILTEYTEHPIYLEPTFRISIAMAAIIGLLFTSTLIIMSYSNFFNT